MKRDRNKYDLPSSAVEYINEVVRKVRYRKKIRADVRAELIGHFEDALEECKTDDQREQAVKELITEFGDAKVLAKLIRRGKKRCRPVWKKVVVRTLQVFGCLILFILFRGLTLTIGKPTISVDYTQWLNELVRDGRDESQNAYPHYAKAFELMPEDVPEILKVSMPDLPENMTSEDEKIIADFLKASEPAFEEMRKGVRKDGFWGNYNRGEDNSGDDIFGDGEFIPIVPNLTKYVGVSKSLALRCNWQRFNRDYKGALNDAVTIYRFGDQMLGQGLLVEQLASIAINAMGAKSVIETLALGDFSTVELKVLQGQIGSAIRSEALTIDFAAEFAFWYDLIQRGFTDDGDGNGRVLVGGLPFVFNDVSNSLKGVFLFDFPDKKQISEEVEKKYSGLEVFMKKTPAKLNVEGWDEGQFIDELTDIALLKILMPAYGTLSEKLWRLIADRDALITIISILRYEKETGSYPESLEGLVDAGLIDEVPIDPFSDKPLVYKKTGDGFMLYSVGSDFEDDGGVVKLKRKGDLVYWPADAEVVDEK